ncbi:hypothetical protein J21TS3_16730 [Paenibacillus cookii]|uniref:Uncharacterized protein n=2 Tax=Paenibacillus TaxID=44249 RepID=A0ABQ4LU97_9BACL|nr:hypothetical protein J21TS3_16730 [Paenibacillus cookii]
MFVSMKSVEMQIAIPRTTEAGRIQNDIHHRTSQEQEFLAGQQQKEAQELRQKSAGVDETANAAVRDEGKRHPSRQKDPSRRASKPEETGGHKDAEHPYKGHRLDVSL